MLRRSPRPAWWFAPAILLVCSFAWAGITSASLVGGLEEFPLPKASTVPPQLAAAIEHLQKGELGQAREGAERFLRDNPNSALGHEVLGTAQLAQGGYDDAERSLRKALGIDRKRALSMAMLGQVAVERGQVGEAEGWFSKAISQDPGMVFAYRGRALALLRGGRLEEAFAAANESLRISEGRDVDTKIVLAGVLHELERHAEAEQVLQDVLSEKPELPEAVLLQGIVKLELQKFDEASALLVKSMARDPGSPWARLGLGVIRRLEGDLAGSREVLEAVAQDKPDWSLAHIALAETLIASDRLEEAKARLGLVEQKSPNPAIARYRIAQLLLKYGYVDEAIERLRPVIGQLQPRARMVLVQAYLTQGQAQLAEQELRDAAAEEPAEAFWPLQLGRLFLAKGRHVEALSELAKAGKLPSGSIDQTVAVIQAYAALKDSQQAVSAAKQLMALRGETADAYGVLGLAYELTGQSKEAEQAYRDALARVPSHLAAMRALAGLYLRTQRTEQAIQLLQHARELHPDQIALVVDLAQCYEQSSQHDRAVALYRQGLQDHAHDPVLLNNLAVLLSSEPLTLAEAEQLAQRAYRLSHSSPMVIDTLGWIAFQRGDLDQAQVLIGKASSMASGDPQITAHLQALAKRRAELAETALLPDGPEVPRELTVAPILKKKSSRRWFGLF